MSFRVVAAMALAIAPIVAPAQSARAASAAATAEAGAASRDALAPYRSTLRDYRRFEDEPVASWRQANDTVLRIGGWKAYAREAQAAQRANPAPTGDAPRAGPAIPAGHEAHHGGTK